MAKKEQSGQPRSAGYRILHETLCVIAALLLFFCFCNTAALRIYSRSDSLSAGLRASRISDAEVPFTGKNVTDYIMSGYVDDSEVLSEDIQTAADSMKIPEFLAEKFEQQSALLRGDANEPLQITPDEISGKLDQISEELYASCKLIIEESDRTQIESALEKPLSVFNSVSGAFGSTKAGRLVLRFGVSIFAYIAEAVLIVLLLLRWGKIRKKISKLSIISAGSIKTAGWSEYRRNQEKHNIKKGDIMKKRVLGIALSAFLAASMLTACGGSAEPAAPAAAPDRSAFPARLVPLAASPDT